jgi:hypothetical protein
MLDENLREFSEVRSGGDSDPGARIPIVNIALKAA